MDSKIPDRRNLTWNDEAIDHPEMAETILASKDNPDAIISSDQRMVFFQVKISKLET